jgi:hypothetical protein
VVTENDRLWQTLRQVQKKNRKEPEPIPKHFQKELNACRSATGKLMHRAAPVTQMEAQELNARVNRLREGLEKWLRAEVKTEHRPNVEE